MTASLQGHIFRMGGLDIILLESVILDRKLQFVVELMKELKKMLEIEMRLSIAFHP